jgi:hypothetical protein
MPTDSEDPSVIRSIAVTAEDVVTATETNRTSDRTAVLRVTPPFSGRMRARLHVQQTDPEGGAVHIPPETLLSADVPAYPRPAETEDEVRADPDLAYSVETHRQYHEQAVEDWRETIAGAICDSVSLPTTDGHEVTVHVLGDS